MTDLLAALGNIDTNDDRASEAGPSEHRASLKPPASSSKASAGKGKQPERTLKSPQQPEPTESSSRPNPVLLDDSDEELPAKLTADTFSPHTRKSARSKKIVDYGLPPPTIDEFEI
jgi:hypothetical protein